MHAQERFLRHVFCSQRRTHESGGGEREHHGRIPVDQIPERRLFSPAAARHQISFVHLRHALTAIRLGAGAGLFHRPAR